MDEELFLDEDLTFSVEKDIEEGRKMARKEFGEDGKVDKASEQKGKKDGFRIFFKLSQSESFLNDLLDYNSKLNNFGVFRKRRFYEQGVKIHKELKEFLLLSNPNNINDKEYMEKIDKTSLDLKVLFKNTGILKKVNFVLLEKENEASEIDF